MLNEDEIESYHNSLSEHLVDKSNVVYQSNHVGLGCLIDSKNVLVCVSTNFSSLKCLVDGEKQEWPSFKTSQMQKFPIFDIEKCRPWLIRLNEYRTDWVKNTNIESIEQLHNYIFLNEKCASLDRLHNYINHFLKFEFKQDNGVQQFIYTSKYLEAKEILEKNIIEDSTMQFPYVSGYANVMDISLNDSAKMIKLQHEMASSKLAEFENIRIKYKNLITNETEISNLKSILNSFYVQFRNYSIL